jgi:YfiR/HmsC-like
MSLHWSAGPRCVDLGRVLILAALLSGPLAIAADEVPPKQQVLILSRALVYDDKFKQRVGPEVRIGILTKSGNAASEATSAAMIKAWKGMGNLKLSGVPLRVDRLGFKDASTLAATVAAEAIDVLYLCPGLENNLREILELSRKRQIVTIGGREEHVTGGASLGVFLNSGRATIMVNLTASRSEGASFSSDLLRLAKVIR